MHGCTVYGRFGQKLLLLFMNNNHLWGKTREKKKKKEEKKEGKTQETKRNVDPNCLKDQVFFLN